MAIAQPTYPNGPAPQSAGLELALVIALHLGVVAALLSFDVLPLPASLATLMVRVIQAPPEEQAEITPPHPKPMANKSVARSHASPAPERPLLAAVTQAPAAVETSAIEESSPPVSQPVTAIVPVAAASEPRFDAAYLDNPAPVYPATSRRLGENGHVILRVYVESNGRPSQVEIKASSGAPRLDQAAQDAVSRWKFVPARRGAEPVGAWVLVPIVFNLRG
jgi:protein TonB